MDTVIIGLDGADWQVIEPLMQAGELPALRSLMAGGCHGILKSTIPPHSPTAWASMITGVNAGKHGIFDFTVLDRNHRPVQVPMMSRLGAVPLWRTLNAYGTSTGIVNLPILYPPEEVRGFLVCGMVTPRSAEIYTWPERLSRSIGSPMEHWIIGEHFAPGGTYAQMLAEIREKTKRQADVTVSLVGEFEPSFLMVVFDGTDKLQHFFWKFLDTTHPRHNPDASDELRCAIPDFYRELDGHIARIVAAVGDANVFVVSDHGFTSLSKDFYVEEWLLQEGYARLGSPIPSASNGLVAGAVRGLWRAAAGPSAVKSAVKRIHALTPWVERARSVRDQRGRTPGANLDWRKTRACLAGTSCQGLQVAPRGLGGSATNVPAGEYADLMQELRARLLRVIDPETQSPVFRHVYLRDELYSGPRLADAPHLVVVPEQGYAFQRGYPGHLFGPSLQFGKDRSGVHRVEGIFIASGPDVKHVDKPIELEMVDIMPTVLYLSGVPVPEHVDGTVLMPIIRDGFRSPNLPELTDQYGLTTQQACDYSAEEGAQVEEHLRGIGYL